MAVTFDPEKNARNITERGLSFERVADLDWETAVIAEDTRRDYGEPRLLVMARLDGRLHGGRDASLRGFARHQLSQGKQTRGKTLWQKRRKVTGPRARMTTTPSGRRRISPGRGQRRRCFRN